MATRDAGIRRAQEWATKQRAAAEQAKNDKRVAAALGVKTLKRLKPVQPKKPLPMAVPGTTSGGTSSGWGTAPTGSVWITGTFPSGSASISSGSASITFEPTEAVEKPPNFPFDDSTRHQIEQKLLNEISRCLAANHYPKGIAVGETAWSLLRTSALVEEERWSESPHHKFMGVTIHVVDVDDPWFMEVGW